MSTRSSIVWGKDISMWHELADMNTPHEYDIHLRLQNVPFSAGTDGVSLVIPAHIWEVIRTHGAVEFDLADLTDDELKAQALDWATSYPFDGSDETFEECFNDLKKRQSLQREIRAKTAELNTIEKQLAKQDREEKA